MTSDRSGPAAASAPEGQQRNTKGARTKALIKRTIVDLVGERGPLEVTLQDICKAANVTVGAFYFHFRNKDAALEETAMEAARTYYDALVPPLDDRPLRERLEDLMQAFLDNYTERQEETRFLNTMLPASQEVQRVHQEERARLHQQLQTLIRDARESADLTLGTEYFGAEFLLTATDAFLERLYSGQDPRLQVAVGSPELVRQNMAAIWDRAILNPSPIADYL